MKIAFVVGFYDPVLRTFAKRYALLLQEQSLFWIPPARPHGDGDWKNLKEFLFDRLNVGASEILLLYVVRRGREEEFGNQVDEIIRLAKESYPEATFTPRAFLDALDTEVSSLLDEFFGPFEPPSLPGSLDDLDHWCACNLGNKLVLHSRAGNAARKSRYEDVELVFRSLHLLAEEYRDMRLKGRASERRRLEKRLRELGLHLSPSISKAGAGEHGEEYYVLYPRPGKQDNRELLDLHLKKGSSREERFCLRIYFFWDKENKLVVVGSLPGHLDTGST